MLQYWDERAGLAVLDHNAMAQSYFARTPGLTTPAAVLRSTRCLSRLTEPFRIQNLEIL